MYGFIRRDDDGKEDDYDVDEKARLLSSSLKTTTTTHSRDLESNVVKVFEKSSGPARGTLKTVAIGALCVGAAAVATSTRGSFPHHHHHFRLGEEEPADSTERIVGNGASYRGKQTTSVTGKECKRWVQTTLTPDDHPADGLYENYCRNPGGVQESIFCFVGGGDTEPCEPLGYDSKVELTKDREEVERLQQELVQAEREAKTPADGVANPQEPQVGEIIVTEEVPVTYGPTADEMDDTIGTREPMQFQGEGQNGNDPDGSFAEDGQIVQPQSPDDERVVGDGQAYRGKQTKSKSGAECKKWVQTTTTPDNNPTEGLEENFCRNPHGSQESIWCYIGGGQSELCDPLGSGPSESAEPDANVIAASVEQATEEQQTAFTDILQEVEHTADALKTQADALQAQEQELIPPNTEASVGFDETPEEENVNKEEEEKQEAKKRGNFDPAIEVIEGDGTSYRGFQTHSKTGKECVAWQFTQRTAFDYPDGDLSGNFCRNPDNQKSIYCYVGNNVAELCEPLSAPKELNNANIKEAVEKCLQEAPNDGNCPHFGTKSQFGVMKDWDVSKVTNMQELFKGKEAFNGDLSGWNTSSLTNAYQMFYSCALFNSDISNWDVSNVENFQGMFNGNAAFNADISKWNTNKAKTMQGMFKNAINFNQDISNWDTSKVENFVSQFEGAEMFNHPIGKWNTGASKSDGMQGMFQRAKSFSQDVSSFIGQASNQNQGMMFSGATAFHARFKCAMPDMGPPATCKDTAAAVEQQLGESDQDITGANDGSTNEEGDNDIGQNIEIQPDAVDMTSLQRKISEMEEATNGEDPELQVQDADDERVIDNGLTYRGKQTHTRSGVECKNWVQTTITPDDNPGQGLEANYCRNPNGLQETIFCFIGNGETEACDAKVEL